MFCASLAFIDGVGAPEMVLIFVVVLVLFGGQKLPEFARGLGKSIREFKKAAAGVEEEFKRALEEDERKHATPQLAAPASASTAAVGAVADQAGPSADPHHDPSMDHEMLTDDMPPPDHVTPTPESTPASPADPTILPPATTVASTTPTPPKPVTPPPANDYPENPS